MLKKLHQILQNQHQQQQPAEPKLDFEDNLNLNEYIQSVKQQQFPWFSYDFKNDTHYVKLNKEIINYIKFAKLSLEEKTAREDLIQRIRVIINTFVKADVHAYGSYASELASYYSDIDIGIETKQKLPFNIIQLITEQIASQIGKAQYIQAKVPIIKGTDEQTLIDFDISINNTGETLTDVRNALLLTDVEKSLVIVIKAFLRQRGLHTPHTGGISGHILTQMIQTYTQNRSTIFQYQLHEDMKYATSLMEFLEMYGVMFNTRNCYIFRDIQNQLQVRLRSDAINSRVDNQGPFTVITQISQKEFKDIAGGVFNYRTIKTSFEVNFYYMQEKSKPEESILGRLINIDRYGLLTREKSVVLGKSMVSSENASCSGISRLDQQFNDVSVISNSIKQQQQVAEISTDDEMEIIVLNGPQNQKQNVKQKTITIMTRDNQQNSSTRKKPQFNANSFLLKYRQQQERK